MERVKITNGTIVFSIMFIILLAMAFFARFLIITSLIGIGIGTLISPLLSKLRAKLHFPRSLSAFIVFLGILLVIAGVTFSVYYLVADQVNALMERSPEIYRSLQSWTSSMFDRYPWIKERINQLDLGQAAKTSLLNVLQGFKVGLIAVSGGIIALVIGLYTALNAKEYRASVVEAFSPKYRPKADAVLGDCGHVLQGWFKAQLIDMLIIGVLTAVGLWISKVEYWAVFGLLTAVMGIIPYVGILLVVTIAALITLATDPGQVPWVLLVFGVTQQLEGHVIIPMVMKGQIELPVVPLVIFMLVMGQFFGILGAFIAPPMFAVGRTIYLDVYLPYLEKKLFSV